MWLMPSAIAHTLQIDPAVLEDAVHVLDEGKSCSAFVTDCVRVGIAQRRAQAEFLTRARDAVERGIREGGGITPQEILKRVGERIEFAFLAVKRRDS